MLAENPPLPLLPPPIPTLPTVNDDRSCNGHCFGNDCLDKQKTICIINVWIYTETLPVPVVSDEKP